MGEEGSREHCGGISGKLRGVARMLRETEVRKNPEALPETYCLSPTFQNGVLSLRNKYKNELSILCSSRGI